MLEGGADTEAANDDKFTKDNEDGFTTWEGIKMIQKQSIWPILGMIFHPLYMLTNAVLLAGVKVDYAACGRESAEETLNSTRRVHWSCIGGKTLVAAFGVGSSFLGIFFLSSGICYTLGLNNIIP